MISMEGVPSSLILRNESWVRKHANALVRRLPANVEKADLIQAGLIAVAQAAMNFECEGDRDTVEAREAFVRYARQRVHGAMIDELRQMDHMSRARRRQVKLVQVARERWRNSHDSDATAAQLGALCGLSVADVFALEADARQGQLVRSDEETEGADGAVPRTEPSTPQDEVEARVDTGILMRRMESFFATLPERHRRVIDAYLGVGLSPTELAAELKLTPSRMAQIFKSVCASIGVHLRGPGEGAHGAKRSTDRVDAGRRATMEDLITCREAELGLTDGAWGERLERALAMPQDLALQHPADEPVVVNDSTRWG